MLQRSVYQVYYQMKLYQTLADYMKMVLFCRLILFLFILRRCPQLKFEMEAFDDVIADEDD